MMRACREIVVLSSLADGIEPFPQEGVAINQIRSKKRAESIGVPVRVDRSEAETELKFFIYGGLR